MSVQGVVNANAAGGVRLTRSKRSAHPGEGEGEDNMSDAPQHVSKHAKQAPSAAAAAVVNGVLAPVQPAATRVLRNISNNAQQSLHPVEAAANKLHGQHNNNHHVPLKKSTTAAAAAPIPKHNHHSNHHAPVLVEEIIDDAASEHSDKVLTRAQARGEQKASRKTTRAAGHSSSSVASSRSTTSSRVGHAAAAVAVTVQEDEDEQMADQRHQREDSQQPGLKARLRSRHQQEADEEEEEPEEYKEEHDHVRHIDDEPIAMNEEEEAQAAEDDDEEQRLATIASKPVPHAHHKHAKAHLHVAPTAAAVAASLAEHAPLYPAVVAAAAPAAASSSSAAAPLAFADQAQWMQCRDDPCQEYSDSIYQHLRATELLNFPDPAYMETVQGDLTHAMRSILVDWLVEVALEYKLASQSLFLGVAFMDRFLSRQAIDRSRLQLVGVSALLLAAKYWEIWPPPIDEFVYISDNTYSKAEVLLMESTLLQSLKFKLTCPTSWEFSRRFAKAAEADRTTECLLDYLLELMLQEPANLSFRPSVVAASALFLALYTRHRAPWSERLETQTGIRVEELQNCVRTLHAIYVKTCLGQHTLRAIKDKYATEQYCCVSNIQPRNM
jgi:cyclin A